MAEALVGAEGVGDGGQGLAEMLRQHLPVGDVVGHPSQAVHVVGKGDQARRYGGKPGEGVAHHGGARDLGEGADMGQAGGTVTGLEQHVTLAGQTRGTGAAQTVEDLSRLLERPGPALHGGPQNIAHPGATPYALA